MLLSGWIIVLAAVALLKSAVQLSSFVLAGLGVELLGLTLVVRSHFMPRGGSG